MYTNMKKIYKKYQHVFPMAVAHILNIGFRNAEKITDDTIENCEGNGLMTKEFVEDILRATKEIVNECDNLTEIIQFCAVEEVFDTEFYGEESE